MFAFSEKSEKRAEDGFRSVERNNRFRTSVSSVNEGFRCQEASDMIMSDMGNKHISVHPFFEGPEVPHVDGSRERAFPVSLELPVKAIYGGREFHCGFRSDKRFAGRGSQLYSAKSTNQGVIPAHSPGSGRMLASAGATLGHCG